MPRSLVTSGWIKICGIRDVAMAEVAAAAGASAIGLNFFSKSSRFVMPADAALIVSALAVTPARPIGLFVNQSRNEIESITAQAGLTAIQLHGDETPEFVHDLHRNHPDWAILKAFRIGDNLQPVAAFLAECNRLNVPLAGCLLDARVDGSFGGTGTVAPGN